MFPSVHTENLFPWDSENNGFNTIMMHFHKLLGSKEQKRQCMALATILKPKSKEKRWKRQILLCLIFKNLQNLLRLERPQYWTPYSYFLSFSGKKTQQFLSQFSFGPSFLCKQNYLNSGWVLVYFKSCMWCSNNC